MEVKGFRTDFTDSPDIDELLFNPSKQNYFNNYKGWEGKIVTMSPRAYIEHCKRGFRSIGEIGEVESVRKEAPKTKKYAQQMKQGELFPIPILDYRHGFTQEGLHRAFAAIMAGIEEIPVAIIDKTDERKQKEREEKDARRRELLNKYNDDEDVEVPEPEPMTGDADEDTKRILKLLGL